MAQIPLGLLPEETSDITTLTDDESWAALESAAVGRLAVRFGEGVDIFPVNFAVAENLIYLRSAPGSKLIDLVNSPSVAFEADGSGRHTRWSVVVKGLAERMSSGLEIEESGVLDLPTMTSAEKWNYVRITPTSITGRSFVSYGATTSPVSS